MYSSASKTQQLHVFAVAMAMASPSAPSPSYFSLLPRGLHSSSSRSISRHGWWETAAVNQTAARGPARRGVLTITAEAEGGASNRRQRAPPGVDTRIHWENDDEGWIGGSNSSRTTEKNLFDDKFSDLLDNSIDSHYKFLGVSTDADIEEIKAAYRRLSKEYHPDTTSLPLKAASDKFMRLREIYDVLSDNEKRQFYDWTLVQEVASRQEEKMRIELDDPYMKEVRNWKPVPDMVDRLGGRNMELSDQAKSALTIDIVIIIFSICCIIYVLLFKEPYY